PHPSLRAGLRRPATGQLITYLVRLVKMCEIRGRRSQRRGGAEAFFARKNPPPPPGPRSGLLTLDPLPQRFLRIERERSEAAIGQIFHRPIAPLELVIRRSQRIFGRDAVCAHEVDRGEQKISSFFQ